MEWLVKITITEILKKADTVHIISISISLFCLYLAWSMYQRYNRFMIKQLKEQKTQNKKLLQLLTKGSDNDKKN